MLKGNSLLLNYVLVIFVMVLWGLNVVAIKVLVENMPLATMQAFRILTAGIVIAVILTLGREWKKLTKYEMKYMGLASLFGVIAHHLLLAYGLANTTAVNTSLILALVPLTTSLLAMLMLGDRITKLRLLGVILGFAGVFFINAAGSSSPFGVFSFGDVIVFVAMLVQAASFIFIKKATSTMNSRLLTGWMFLVGAFGIFLYSLLTEPGGIGKMFTAPGYVWVVFFGSAILATAVGHQLFNSSIQKIGPGETAVFNNLVPFFGLLSSAFLLGEAVGTTQWFGFIIIVMGVLLGTGYVEQKWLRKRKHSY